MLTYIHTYTCTHTYIYTHIHIYTYIYTYTYTHTYIHTYTYIHTHTCIHISTYKHTYLCMSMYTHTHVSTHTHIYIYIYIYIYICGSVFIYILNLCIFIIEPCVLHICLCACVFFAGANILILIWSVFPDIFSECLSFQPAKAWFLMRLWQLVLPPSVHGPTNAFISHCLCWMLLCLIWVKLKAPFAQYYFVCS